MVGRQAGVLALGAADRRFLESQVRRHKAPRSLSDRCRMVLLCADGLQSKEAAERLGFTSTQSASGGVVLRKLALKGWLTSIGRGRPRTVSDAQVIERTLNTTPKDAEQLTG